MRVLPAYNITYLFLCLLCHNVLASQEVVMAISTDSDEHHGALLDLSTEWEVLGPFQIGTRGAVSSLKVRK